MGEEEQLTEHGRMKKGDGAGCIDGEGSRNTGKTSLSQHPKQIAGKNTQRM
jgi:hypothetical protein